MVSRAVAHRPTFDGTDALGNACTAEEPTQVMELIINDFWLSFFSSNPAYVNFLPLDLNGEGKMACSRYLSVCAGHERDIGIDEHAALADEGPPP